MKFYTLCFILILSCPKIYSQRYAKMESREDFQNEVSVLAFGRSRYEIYSGLGYERNLFKIRKHSFISLQGEYNRGLFEYFDKNYDYFLIAPKYNVQNGRVITSLYPMFGFAPHLKRRALSLNLSNKYDFPKLKLTFAVNLAVETISYPPTSFSLGNSNPTYVTTWHKSYRLGVSIGKYF